MTWLTRKLAGSTGRGPRGRAHLRPAPGSNVVVEGAMIDPEPGTALLLASGLALLAARRRR